VTEYFCKPGQTVQAVKLPLPLKPSLFALACHPWPWQSIEIEIVRFPITIWLYVFFFLSFLHRIILNTQLIKKKKKVKFAQSCPTLCNPMDYIAKGWCPVGWWELEELFPSDDCKKAHH